jgi:hypothetical protein
MNLKMDLGSRKMRPKLGNDRDLVLLMEEF